MDVPYKRDAAKLCPIQWAVEERTPSPINPIDLFNRRI